MKIFIIGISGSGKSTLASKLSVILKTPCFDLDDIFWIRKYSEKRNEGNCAIELKRLLAKNKEWILEGVYEWGNLAADEADLVIWLNYGINTATYRVIKRWFSRKKEDKESIKNLYNLINYVRTYKKVRPGKKYSTFEEHKKITCKNEHCIVVVKNKKDLKCLLENIKK
jgi:adenylate kinase family enzyme